ncbi:hypothetical protein Ahy_B10g100936 isoform B [Arachis hypogaea]|uniref:Equilibrative nucleotide transporter n=1 Tax=Arachis hypogaea TaxID=3818 RepID=A0A444WY73_ARAHY|nr:hypothetical protein Ahy_B10g100936 isoform A [Arachis hypogaea]RYQ82350.1 hypothetical protein Ahy_B10g100936 isoform B [Arachis hypogaea]
MTANTSSGTAMVTSDENEEPRRLEGKQKAMAVCFILGLGSLVSWNSMLTIGDYYYSVFPKYHPARVLTLVYQPFAIGTLLIMSYYESRINTRLRNLAGFILFFASTFAVLILDLATSGKGGIGPYIGICLLAACFGIADAHVEGGMVGDLCFMCPEFIQSYFAGLAASGALTSILRILTKLAFEKSHNGLRKGAILFLAISTFIEFLCIFLYAIYFTKLPIVKHYRAKAASEGSKTVSADLAAAGIQTMPNDQESQDIKEQMRLGNKQLLLENLDYAADLFLIYVLTLSIFPGFLYAIVLIAMYNVMDLISRYIPLVKCLKLESRKGLLIAVLSRFLLIPAFYFTAKYGDQGWMILLTSFLGLTNGYLTGPEQNALGNLLVLFLLTGIFAGVCLDWLWIIGSLIFRMALIAADDVDNRKDNGAPRKPEGKQKAMLVCFILGLGSLVSWNSMLTIADYYYTLFPKYHPSRVLTLVYQPFALGTIAIMTWNESKINTRMRNLAGYSLFSASTFLVLVLDLATAGKGGVAHFIGLCLLSACFGLADGLVQGGMVGDLSFMCPEFIQSFLAGLAASGALISLLRVLTKLAFDKSHDGLRKGAILFLACSTFIEFVCILLYAFCFPKLPIVKYYRSKAAAEGSKTVSADLAAVGLHTKSNDQGADDDSKQVERMSIKELLLKNLDYAVDLLLIYVITLSIFPGFLYPIVLIAMYNVLDLISRYIPLVKWLKLESRKGILIAVVLRFLLIPAFYFTAKYADQGWMILLTSFLGLTNGYLTGPEQNALGNLLVACLLGGIFAGVVLDWLWLIGHGNW